MPVFEDMANSLQHIKGNQEAIPHLAKWTSVANQQVAIMNNQMAELYKRKVKND